MTLRERLIKGWNPARLQTIRESLNVISIDASEAPECCEYCGEPGDLRPYGKDGEWICFKCGMSEENIEDTEAKFADILDGVASNGVLNEMKINESAGDTFEFHLSTEPDLIEGKPFSQQTRTVSSEGERGDMGAEEKGVIYATDSPEDWYQQFESELADAPEFIPNNLYIVKVKNPSKGSHLSQSINKPEDVVVIEKVPNTDEGTPDFKRGYAMLNKLQKSPVTESKTSSIAVDFDHTVHSYENGFSDDHFDPPVPGAIEALDTLCGKYNEVFIFTARTELAEVELWLKYQFQQAGITYPNNLSVTHEKPIADIYVDDRGYQFTGDWSKTLKDMDTYKTWVNEHRLPTIRESYALANNVQKARH